MLEIKDFSESHIEEAQKLLFQNHKNERECVNTISDIDSMPDLLHFSQNGLGVSAFDGTKFIGYLCAYGPLMNNFNTISTIGIWSPLESNGVIKTDDGKIIAKIYQEAARRWVAVGALDHRIGIFAHNHFLEKQLFNYGFGLRCIDAIRPMEEIETAPLNDIHYKKAINYDDFERMAPLFQLKYKHFEDSPLFMRYPQPYPTSDEIWLNRKMNEEGVMYYAEKDDTIIAYMRVTDEGENYISNGKDIKNIKDTYCLPEYRGKGIIQNLMNYVIGIYKNEGFTRLGVDFESFNPTARGFWLKYFTEYSHGLERRIDDRIR